MRLVVDLVRCQGYAQCAFLAPDVFTMHGEEALLYNPHADAAQRENVLRAATACPVRAITVEDTEAPTGTGGRVDSTGVGTDAR
ncbi:ferredoxin [Streptomyces sp. SAJ15]|uniref:ferredoxin n=1 Tax=Streptomyces sp. SAJ15 TaxID=2011095 RepID=UPI0011869DAC|nr:ferredoxin [Streptomyces sp. SAJ15]TVL92235.1 ferredoxin [Streptomyces sp. SAJ15]